MTEDQADLRILARGYGPKQTGPKQGGDSVFSRSGDGQMGLEHCTFSPALRVQEVCTVSILGDRQI